MRPVPRSLILSIAAHAAGLTLLAWLATGVTPIPAPPPLDVITVAFALPPPPAPAEQPPSPAAAPPPEPVMPPPPPAPIAEAPVPPPAPKPAPKPRPRPIVHEAPLPNVPPPVSPPLTPQAPQTAAIPPAPPAAPVISADYRSALGAWLESHKRYPESARQHGEQGQAVVRFRVDRGGRVLTYAIVSGTGYPDLDAAIETMLRGASLPAFPASMTEPEIEVSVTIRFGLTR